MSERDKKDTEGISTQDQEAPDVENAVVELMQKKLITLD
jgi:hypothetical protein